MGPAGRLPWLRRKGRWQQELRPREAAGNHAANRASPRLHVGFLPGAPPPSSAAPRWVGQGQGAELTNGTLHQHPVPIPGSFVLLAHAAGPSPTKALWLQPALTSFGPPCVHLPPASQFRPGRCHILSGCRLRALVYLPAV